MKGRKPTPIEQRAREGNPRRHPLPEPVRLSDRPLEKPAGLPSDASELWDDLAGVLSEAGVLHRVDSAALEALCLQWERGRVAARALETDGYFALGSTGQIVEHPAIAIERQAHLLFLRFSEQFGITPVARARIAAAAAISRSMRQELTDELKPKRRRSRAAA